MTSLPSISLVTCSFQQGEFIGSTIRSVLAQNYPSLEYLVIDGGSTDRSVAVIRDFESSLDYWVSEPDGGQTEALAKGLALSTGELQGWLCSDDLLLPGTLEKVGQYFASHPEAEWLYGDAVWIDVRGRPIRPKKEMPWNRTLFLFDHNYLAQPSVFWRRRLFDRVGGLQTSWNLAMDSDLWLRFAAVSRPHHLRQYLACMRSYPEQKTMSLRSAGRKEDEKLRRREAPMLAGLPRLPVRVAARVGRITLKALSGGYAASIPDPVMPWLAELEINR